MRAVGSVCSKERSVVLYDDFPKSHTYTKKQLIPDLGGDQVQNSAIKL